MIEVKSEQIIITFDGHVVDVFYRSGKNERMHVDFVEDMRLERHRKGTMQLMGKMGNLYIGIQLSDETIPHAEALLRAVREAQLQGKQE